ncbi:pyruvate/2-oxoglutarate/acetoin dehydrogenase E1 component/TPP-dependent pyruvate/acetoin dehydrogenase alpha subunit [Aquimarina sp. EL_43]|uniref:alpha-ketoacid dehydrogenase subunit alpha/beta n=1 Tax=unclassified Aquimarina TaxID=2627091 RepID=UPI0018CAC5EF|nr:MULTISPECIES: alpha-ketoacid dehydrogenase subunit alpha/beta [unclassified Aquimarina]MBG6129799.1 pyruvate/2-oxoglutarate/acetoin dehydrogenase E1 component/TPP-dependent pyruvate/acetoin dehydrogenase alpha subunit [Aquimarina sp. EL_35]MBG6150864.1 pyruvate/2-oxoglutarate/acetoin dehydrogenase E1 component/TPP-dependent pyruvate/acetoin dehydrogenase alpha subunit [Aquimarina sp. EL_32]MBG6167829.1 pyruvate/2-oxoglutarate/acetoin dehydrogenase E1 component/TPP-dependent pyruvate/acetoin d
MQPETITSSNISFEEYRDQILRDYKIALISRECSLLGRREVLTGKSKFGIFGGGKELPQLAMARVFRDGDFRSGYYRDQTFMMAIDQYTVEQFFAGLYAHTDINKEPFAAGRQMGGHFSTHSLNEDGTWKNLMQQKNSSADISPTAGQMPRLLGLAQASKVYRNEKGITNHSNFSSKGNEVAWGTIGNASTSEGLFWETINAGGVLQVPMVVSVWDDEYGISVHAKHQTTKEDISLILEGFRRDENHEGYEILKVNGWDYPALMDAYEKAEKLAREKHIPVIIHVKELTQPQGHSTSGSHERYKSEERLNWEREYDCNKKFKEWIIEHNIATAEELLDFEKTAKKEVRKGKTEAWNAYLSEIKSEQKEALEILKSVENKSANKNFISSLVNILASKEEPIRRDILEATRKTLQYITKENFVEKSTLQEWINNYISRIQPKYSSHLYNENDSSAIHVKEVKAQYDTNTPQVDGRVILRDNFEKLFSRIPEALIFGEDSGKIGDVNQGLEGLQEKFGETRVSDTGIREATIIGQGIGMAMRGLRPIAEIQYLDYILYCIQGLSDDLATLRYRTFAKQKAPLIIRTRGHRLEGIWHSGSQMGGLIHLLRGIHILVPRNMTKAAGFYNTLMDSDEPALVVECLNGYRLKEKMPSNLSEIRTPIGIVETVKEGTDITLVSYGSTLRLVEQAAKELLTVGINAEIIDVQSLLPFDLNHDIVKSVAKTNRLLIIDEDVPGGATGYILHKLIDEQNVYQYLDSKPQTLSAQPHRPAFGTDGDYFSKPSTEDIFEKVYAIINEANPANFPKLR